MAIAACAYDDFMTKIGPVAAAVAKEHGTTLLFERAALESEARQWSWDHIEPVLLILFNER